MVWPALFSAGEILIAAQGRPEVYRCNHKHCSLLFIDRTPKRRRRFCSRTCSNRAKSLRQYYRTGKAERERKMRSAGMWVRTKARRNT